MSIKDKLTRAICHPEVVRRKAGIVMVRPFTQPDGNTIGFLKRDWDILIVLDACRYDLFERYNPFDTRVEKIHSNASQTREFIKNNFVGRDCRDIVYVTASPQFAQFDLQFARIEHVWQDQWDEDLRTVPPDAVTNAALDIANQYGDKRVIVHYMQPHYPFIGPIGRDLSEQATFGRNMNERDIFVPGSKPLSVWEQLSGGKIDEATVRKAYEENLLVVLPAVKRLVANTRGKAVVTSDHGNLFGNQVCWLPIRIYGHPARIHHPELTAVPWVELPYECRREITPATEVTEDDVSSDALEKRLSNLGYVQ